MTNDMEEMPNEEVVVKKRLTKFQLRQEKEKEELRQVLSTRNGRNVIWRILGKCEVFSSGMGIDPHHMAYTCGRREVGLNIFDMINQADRGAYALMVNENMEIDNE